MNEKMALDRPVTVDLFRRQTDVMRGNLVAVCRMALKSLVDQSCFYSISDECEEFINFCAVLEGILNHRIRCSKTWMGERQFHYWDYLQATCRLLPHSCIANIAGIENIRSAEAKGRAFIRCALMEKRLSEYLSFAVKQVNLTKKFYEEGAVMLSEDGPVLCGMLLGLNAIDFSFCLKGSNSELQGPLEVNFKPFLHFKQSEDSLHSDAEEMRELSVSSESSQGVAEEARSDSADSETRLRQVERQYRTAAEQKGYLEELVRLREGQLEEAQEQARTAQTRLQRLENEWRTERRQLETVILELQGQLTTMKSVYHALQQKLSGMSAQQSSTAPPPHSVIPMVELASDATVSYSAVTHQLTQSFRRAETSREGTPQHGDVRRLQQQDTVSVSSASTFPRDDNRSLMSGSSGHFGTREDTQSLIPLAGSISSEFGIRPSGVVTQAVEVELVGGVGQEVGGGREEAATPSDEASLSSTGQGGEGEVVELEKSYQAHEVSQATALAREEKKEGDKESPTPIVKDEEAVTGGTDGGEGDTGRGEGDGKGRQGDESLTGPGSRHSGSSTSDTPDSWELVSENGREEQRHEEGQSEREGEGLRGEVLQGGAAQYYSLGVPQEEEEEEETEEGTKNVADPHSRETAPTQGERSGSGSDPSDLVMVSSSEDSAPLSGGEGGTAEGEEEGERSAAQAEESEA